MNFSERGPFRAHPSTWWQRGCVPEGEAVTYGCGNDGEVSACRKALSGSWSGREAQTCKETNRRRRVNALARLTGEGKTSAAENSLREPPLQGFLPQTDACSLSEEEREPKKCLRMAFCDD